MNLIVFESNALSDGNLLTLCGERARHLYEIKHVRSGARLLVGERNGKRGSGLVESADPDRVVLKITLDASATKASPTILCLALPRPQMLKRILQTVAMFSLEHVFLIGSDKVEKSYISSPLLKSEGLHEQLLLGLEQGMQTHCPKVSIVPRFSNFLKACEADFPRARRLCAEQRSQQSLADLAPAGIDSAQRVLLAVGPEGGWTDREREQLSTANFESFTIGDRVLRVETAVSCLLGQLELLRSLSGSKSGRA